MSLPGAAQQAAANRAKVAAKLTQGVSLLTALLYITCYGIPKSATVHPASVSRFKSDFGWRAAEGTQYEVKVGINRPTATQRAIGGLRKRDFAELNTLATAAYSYYTIEETFGVSSDYIKLNRGNKTKLVNMLTRAQNVADQAVRAAWAAVPHYGDETGHNGGVTMLSPTNVSGSTEFASIALDATDDESVAYWQPGGYDYGANTIAADFLLILEGTADTAETSQKEGGGTSIRPDFGIMDPDAWMKMIEYFQDNGTVNFEGRRNLNLMEAGFVNVVVDNIVLCKENQFGGSTGYIDGAAAEEILLGHSSALNIVTTSSKKEGLVEAIPILNDTLVTGVLGAYASGPFAFVVDDPKKFALAYT